MKSLALFLILFTPSIPGHGRQWLILSASEMNIRAGSLAGHAFVTFLRDNPTSKKIEEVGTWGFYPKDGGGIFSIVPGEIRMDTWRERSASFTVAVSQQEFTNAYRVMEKWNGGNYLLTGSNCVNFLKEIISVIPKLAPPNIVYQAPVPFINKLTEVNRAHNQLTFFKEYKAGEVVYATRPSNLSPSPLATALFSKREEFANYSKTELSKDDMNTIAERSGLRYDPVKKSFASSDDTDVEYPFQVFVTMIDFNKDGFPEVYINYYNYHYHGQRSEEAIFVKQKGGSYGIVLKERGSSMLLTTKNLGYPDILIGGPGMTAPGFRWNGSKYVFHRTYPFGEKTAPKFLDVRFVN